MTLNYSAIFLTLASKDLEQLTTFYRHLLGQEAKIYRPGVYTEFQLPGLRLGIFQPQVSRQQEFHNSGSSFSLCLEVANLEQAIATLTNLGYPPPGSIIEASHGREIYAYDPEGNRLILHQSFLSKK